MREGFRLRPDLDVRVLVKGFNRVAVDRDAEHVRCGLHRSHSANGRNLLEPYHYEFAGDNANPVGIRRGHFAGLQWTQ
jgi:hypothetical protein